MRFNILGPLEINLDAHRTFVVGGSKTGQVLGLLLARRQETVSVDVFIEELWGERPPRSALTTLQTYIYHARRLFARESLAPLERDLLVTRPAGYMVRLEADELDASVFEDLVREGKSYLEMNRADLAAKLLRKSLDLWRGPAFASIPVGNVLNAHATRLNELRIRGTQLLMQAERQLGRYQEIIPELRSLVVTYELNEYFHAQLIEALYRSGRRGEALQAYQHLRRVLDSQLGLEPGPEIQQLQQEILQHR